MVEADKLEETTKAVEKIMCDNDLNIGEQISLLESLKIHLILNEGIVTINEKWLKNQK